MREDGEGKMLFAEFKKFMKQNSLHALTALFAIVILNTCKSRTFNAVQESDLLQVEQVEFERGKILETYRFELITPTGERLFAAAKEWMRAQEAGAAQFAGPSSCANNISRVFEMAGINSYSSPVPADIVNAIRSRGGLSVTLSRNRKIAAEEIQKYFGGALPAGTLVSSCRSENCSGHSIDNTLGIVGEVDSSELIQVYHNNSYRPENRPWQPHMIPLTWYRQGYQRKWMPTPWISLSRDAQSVPVEIKTVLPEIEQLDPENFRVSLTLIPEILTELKNGQAVVSDGAGAVMPYSRRLQNVQTVSQPQQALLADCKKLKTNTETVAYLREQPKGQGICRFTHATPLEKIAQSGRWTKVKGVCPDGRLSTGYVLSAYLVPACE
jgi:hypothetical protein